MGRARVCSRRRSTSPSVPGRDRADPRAGVRGRAAAARKRGLAPTPTQRVVINHRVCEGCGDCGRVEQLPLGAAVRHAVRSQDHDRPDHVQPRLLVHRGRLPLVRHRDDAPGWRGAVVSACSQGRRENRGDRSAAALARRHRSTFPRTDARRCRSRRHHVRMVGIGGTGVVTVAQVLGTAAMLDGYQRARARPDRTLAEGRPGRVATSTSRATTPTPTGSAPGRPTCSSRRTCWWRRRSWALSTAAPDRTVVVGSTSETPVGAMITHPETPMPSATDLIDRLRTVTRDERALGRRRRHHLRPLRRRHQCELLPRGHGGAARRPPDRAGAHRAGDRAQRCRGRRERRRVPVGTLPGERSRRARRPHVNR